MGMRKILRTNDSMTGTMTQNILLTRFQGGKTMPTYPGWGPEGPIPQTPLTLKRRKNVVDDVTNVEQHELLGFDASRPLPDVIPERANSFTVVGVLSRFFQATAAASAIGHVCQARSEVQAEKG